MTPPKQRLPPGWSVEKLPDGRYYYADYHGYRSSIEAPPPCPYDEDEWTRHLSESEEVYWSHPSGLFFYEGDSRWERIVDKESNVFWSTELHGGVRFWENLDARENLRKGGAAAGA